MCFIRVAVGEYKFSLVGNDRNDSLCRTSSSDDDADDEDDENDEEHHGIAAWTNTFLQTTHRSDSRTSEQTTSVTENSKRT